MIFLDPKTASDAFLRLMQNFETGVPPLGSPYFELRVYS